MPQPQATNFRTLYKNFETHARYIKKWVVGADFPYRVETHARYIKKWVVGADFPYRVETHARYIKKRVVGADFPLIGHTNFFFSHLEKVHTMFFSPFQLLCSFFHHEYKRTSLHRTYAED